MAVQGTNEVEPVRPKSPQIHYTPEQVRALGYDELVACLKSPNTDRDTISASLADTKPGMGDIHSAFRAQARGGNFENMDAIALHLRQTNELLDPAISTLLLEALLQWDGKMIEHLVKNYRNEIQKIAQTFAIECASVQPHQPSSPPPELDSFSPHTALIKLLLENRFIKVDERDVDGSTLLHCAGRSKQGDLVAFLGSKNANPFARDRAGKTAWEAAREFLRPDMMYEFVYKNGLLLDSKRYWTFRAGRLIVNSDLIKMFYKRKSPSEILNNDDCQNLLADYRKETNLVHMRENNDLLFTWHVSFISFLLGYEEEEHVTVFQFLSQTFLEEKPTEPRLRFREPSYNSMVLNTIPQRGKVFSIVIPYFYSLSKETLKTERGIWFDNDRGSAEEQIPFLNVHTPRTLDESYYSGLNYHQLSQRNDKQVISKFADGEDKDSLLLVPELWLWRIDNVVVSSLPTIVGRLDAGYSDTDPAAPIMAGGFNPIDYLRTDLHTGTSRFENVDSVQLVTLILSECINFLDRPHYAGLRKSVLFTFEKAVATTFDEVQNYVKEYGMDSVKIEKEKDYINEINDICDELAMIRNVIDQQETIWTRFVEDHKEEIIKWDSTLHGVLSRTDEHIATFKRKIQKIETDAERIQDLIRVQLDLKSKYAGLKEAHNSANLSISVIGFTIITIIFTPLSFLCSLLALPSTRFENKKVNLNETDPSSDKVYTSSFLGRWFTVTEVVSLVVTVLLVVLSFSAIKLIEAYNIRKERNNRQQESRSEPKQKVNLAKSPKPLLGRLRGVIKLSSGSDSRLNEKPSHGIEV